MTFLNKKVLLAFIATFFVLALTGCFSSGGDNSIATAGTTTNGVSNIAIASSTSSLPADGLSQTTITAVATDVNGDAVENATIQFAADAGVLSDIAVATDNNGQATTILTSTNNQGIATVTAKDINTMVSNNVQITFTAVQPTALTISAADAQLDADGNSHTLVTVMVTDVNGNPAANVAVNFATTLGMVSPQSVTTDGLGVAVATLMTGMDAGTATVTAMVAANASVTASTNVTFNAVVITDPVPSTINMSTEETELYADGESHTMIMIEVLMDDGMPAVNTTVLFEATLGHVEPMSVVTDAQGIATATLMADQEAGEATITAALASNDTVTASAMVTMLEVMEEMSNVPMNWPQAYYNQMHNMAYYPATDVDEAEFMQTGQYWMAIPGGDAYIRYTQALPLFISRGFPDELKWGATFGQWFGNAKGISVTKMGEKYIAFIGGSEGRVYAMDLETGETLWDTEVISNMGMTQAVVANIDDHQILFFGAADAHWGPDNVTKSAFGKYYFRGGRLSYVYALDAETGDILDIYGDKDEDKSIGQLRSTLLYKTWDKDQDGTDEHYLFGGSGAGYFFVWEWKDGEIQLANDMDGNGYPDTKNNDSATGIDSNAQKPMYVGLAGMNYHEGSDGHLYVVHGAGDDRRMIAWDVTDPTQPQLAWFLDTDKLGATRNSTGGTSTAVDPQTGIMITDYVLDADKISKAYYADGGDDSTDVAYFLTNETMADNYYTYSIADIRSGNAMNGGTDGSSATFSGGKDDYSFQVVAVDIDDAAIAVRNNDADGDGMPDSYEVLPLWATVDNEIAHTMLGYKGGHPVIDYDDTDGDGVEDTGYVYASNPQDASLLKIDLLTGQILWDSSYTATYTSGEQVIDPTTPGYDNNGTILATGEDVAPRSPVTIYQHPDMNGGKKIIFQGFGANLRSTDAETGHVLNHYYSQNPVMAMGLHQIQILGNQMLLPSVGGGVIAAPVEEFLYSDGTVVPEEWSLTVDEFPTARQATEFNLYAAPISIDADFFPDTTMYYAGGLGNNAMIPAQGIDLDGDTIPDSTNLAADWRTRTSWGIELHEMPARHLMYGTREANRITYNHFGAGSGVALTKGMVIVGEANQKVYGYNALDGQRVWTFDNYSYHVTQPIVVEALPNVSNNTTPSPIPTPNPIIPGEPLVLPSLPQDGIITIVMGGSLEFNGAGRGNANKWLAIDPMGINNQYNGVDEDAGTINDKDANVYLTEILTPELGSGVAYVTALDPVNGNEIWTYFTNNGSTQMTPLFYDNKIYWISGTGQVWSLDVSTGLPFGVDSNTGDYIDTPFMSRKDYNGNGVTDLEDGYTPTKLKFSFPYGLSGGTAFTNTAKFDGCLDGSSDYEKSQHAKKPGYNGVSNPNLFTDNQGRNLMVAGLALPGRIVAMDLDNGGQPVWQLRQDLDFEQDTQGVLGGNTTLFFSSFAASSLAVDEANGLIIGTVFTVDSQGTESGSNFRKNDTMDSLLVFALDPNNLVTRNICGSADETAPAIVWAMKLPIDMAGEAIVTQTPQSGDTDPQNPVINKTALHQLSAPTPVVKDDTAYILNNAGKTMVAINTVTGNTLWTADVSSYASDDNPAWGAGVIVENSTGMEVLVRAIGSYLVTIDIATGDIVNDYHVGGNFLYHHPTVYGKTIYMTNGFGWTMAIPLYEVTL